MYVKQTHPKVQFSGLQDGHIAIADERLVLLQLISLRFRGKVRRVGKSLMKWIWEPTV